MGVAEVFERTLDTLGEDASLGDVEVVLRTARRRGATTDLRVTIAQPDGTGLAACEAVARRINAALADATEGYTLEVESAGLERPLLRLDDYRRFAGRAARVVTRDAIGGAKTHRGVIAGVEGDDVRLTGEGGERALPYGQIKQAHLEFDLRAALRRGEAKAPTRYTKRENRRT